eukprot:333296_1
MVLLILSVLIAKLHCYVIDFNQQDRMFDGIGALSAGASSRLLIDYDEPYRSQVLDYLFKPQFGAALQILKVEIGGDTFSTCGTEASHMHTQNDLDVRRGYENWLMVEAKKRNSQIKLYGLSWGFPSWIGNGALNENQANYTVLWTDRLQKLYHLDMDWLGIWNERAYSTSYVKLLRKMLDENGYNNTRLVVADDGGGASNGIIAAAQNDSDFAKAFDVIGVHYPGASKDTPQMAASGFKLWSSEDSSTNDNNIGGGCWARILNWNYVYGNYTSTIMWPIISSWFEYLAYYGDGLMNAAWPWNGHYEVMSPLWINAHTTQFVDMLNNNWYYVKQGYGSGILDNGGTYVTFMSNNGKSKDLNITIVIETMQYQNSLCIRSNPSDFWNVTTQNITFKLVNSNTNTYRLPTKLYVWKTVLFGSKIYWFEQQDAININSDSYQFTMNNIEPDTVITVTSISSGNKGSYSTPPSKVVFPIPYSDNFQSYANEINNGNDPQPKYFSDQAGSFAVRQALKKANGEYALEQLVPYSPSLNGTAWIADAPQPLTIIGDHNITDYNIAVSAYMISNNQLSVSWNTSNIMVGVRLGGKLPNTGCGNNPREYPCVPGIGSNWFEYGYFLQINDDGYWKLMNGAGNNMIQGNLNMDLRETWFNVTLSVNDYALSASFNDNPLFKAINDSKKTWSSGWAGLACGWQTCQFDNFAMTKN